MTTAVHTRRRAVHESEPVAAPTSARDNAAACGSKALRRAMERSFKALADRHRIPIADAQLLLMNGVRP